MKPTTRERATKPFRASAPRPCILAADADPDTRALYRDSFTRAGCDVVEASDGREALVKAITHPPTLVITEISLPFIDGYALCEILRRDLTTADIPILVVTTESRPGQIDRARKAGADVVLIKPAPIEHILNEIRRLVAGEPAAATSANAATQPDGASNRLVRSKHHKFLSRSFPRMATTTPPASPPELRCPSCDRPLTYERSEIGGVSHRHLEQWDYYACAKCGRFQHRQRTRTLRSIS
jgi:CheY-like chemotaxis protein